MIGVIYVVALYRMAVTCVTMLGVLFILHFALILWLKVIRPGHLPALGVPFAPHAVHASTSAIF